MKYMQCGYYTTCHFLNPNVSRSLECESGCFCEDDKVHYNESCSEIDICGKSNCAPTVLHVATVYVCE